LLAAFLVGLIAGLVGETLLFLERQSSKIEAALSEDFRVVLFMKNDPEAGREKVIEEQLLGMPGVLEAKYVSRRDALAALRRDEPELVESALLLSDNPLLPAFEVKLDEDSLARVAQWAADAADVADWADVRYKKQQVQAALQAQLYRHAVNVVLSAVVCAVSLLVLAGLWPPGRAVARRHEWEAALGGAAGGVFGAGMAALVVLPMRLLTPWWAWPSGPRQTLLLAGAGALGWVLCRRHE
jgi:cell division protein FtsX